MAFTAQQLITNSWYLSGIVSRGLETILDQQISDGLIWLNYALDEATSNIALVPYFKEYDFTAVVNQEIYFVPNLIEVETVTFNIGVVRYEMSEASREVYFSTSRVDNIAALPYQWHFERLNDGGNIYLYFLPVQAYPMKLWGKFGLTNVTIFQDLSLTYETFYILYLTYKTAEYLCQFYNVMFPIQHAKKLASFEQNLRNVIPVDYSMQKMSMFRSGAAFNYGDVNLGLGWRPGGSS